MRLLFLSPLLSPFPSPWCQSCGDKSLRGFKNVYCSILLILIPNRCRVNGVLVHRKAAPALRGDLPTTLEKHEKNIFCIPEAFLPCRITASRFPHSYPVVEPRAN